MEAWWNNLWREGRWKSPHCDVDPSLDADLDGRVERHTHQNIRYYQVIKGGQLDNNARKLFLQIHISPTLETYAENLVVEGTSWLYCLHLLAIPRTSKSNPQWPRGHLMSEGRWGARI